MSVQNRHQMVEQYARQWLDQDREKAMAWLERILTALHRLLNPGQPVPSEPVNPYEAGAPANAVDSTMIMDLEMMRRYGLLPE